MTTIGAQELLAQPVDVLYMAALENQLNKDNMENIQAKIILKVLMALLLMMQINTSMKKVSTSSLTFLLTAAA